MSGHRDKSYVEALRITSGNGAPEWKRPLPTMEEITEKTVCEIGEAFEDTPSLKVLKVTPKPVKPDAYSFVEHDADQNMRAVLSEKTRAWRESGMTWFRYTVVDARHRPLIGDGEPAGYWIECWKEQPRVQADFDPPLSLERPGQ